MSESTAAPAPAGTPHASPATDLLIRADGLSKYYGEFTAIRDVSFTVPRGSVTAFLGPNGAGKSTTIRLLCGLLKPTAGRAIVAVVTLAFFGALFMPTPFAL